MEGPRRKRLSRWLSPGRRDSTSTKGGTIATVVGGLKARSLRMGVEERFKRPIIFRALVKVLLELFF